MTTEGIIMNATQRQQLLIAFMERYDKHMSFLEVLSIFYHHLRAERNIARIERSVRKIEQSKRKTNQMIAVIKLRSDMEHL